MPGRVPPQEEVLRYFQECNSWAKWGPKDQLGTINYITPETRRRAASLVKEGVTVTCGNPLYKTPTPDDPYPPRHLINLSGERWAGKKSTTPNELQACSDSLFLGMHGFALTHVDSICHIFWDGKMYNNIPAEKVTVHEGATAGAIELLKDGILARGILLDIPKMRGLKWLERKEGIFPEDLEAAEKAFNVKAGPGDVVMVRTGALRRRNEEGAWDVQTLGMPGPHGACVPWLHKRQVAMIGGDNANDCKPSGYPLVRNPVHQIGMVAMGLWLIDAVNLEELSAACERFNRWEFMLTVNPLRIPAGTGSPVNPMAVF